jgi:hypothetical protein
MNESILDAIAIFQPCTAAKVAEVVGGKVERVRLKLAVMKEEGPDQQIHVSHWERVSSGVGSRAYYVLGPGENAERPSYDAIEEDAAMEYPQSVVGLELQAEWNKHQPQQPEIFE